MEPTEQEQPLTAADIKPLLVAIDRLTHLVGLAVVAIDRHARVTDRHLSAKAAEATDGIVVVQRQADGSQKVIVRDTASATKAVAAQVEAAIDHEDSEWSTY